MILNTILYEDNQILVINKPAGLVVTPGPGYAEEDTLVGWLVNRYGEELREVGSGAHRPGIVHRLDKGTSGVIVIAKTKEAFEDLVSQFKGRKVTKKYLAMVWGDIRSKIKNQKSKLDISSYQLPVTNFRFTIDAPIGRNPKNRMKFAVVEGAKPARTEFETLKTIQIKGISFTSLYCSPKTGRTHQIRVHLKSFGHGVVGDELYHSRKENQTFDQLVTWGKLSNRMYLHAYQLKIKIPGVGERKIFEAPIPKEFTTYV